MDCDRLSFLQDYLAKRGVDSTVIQERSFKHLFVNFPSFQYNPAFKIKTVICHYDRVPDTPGANDNSAANFAILDFAVRLAKMNRIHNTRIIFTDGEEKGMEGVKCQGAFGLAALLVKNNLSGGDFYVFDSCGKGQTVVLGQTGLTLNGVPAFTRRFADLFARTQELLRKNCDSWMTLPVPFSDNAGFFANGIPAVVISLLPAEEATEFYQNLMREKNLSKTVMNMTMDDQADYKFKYKEFFPKTWRLFHTEYDNLLNLTPESFELMAKILDQIGMTLSPQ